MNDGPNARKRRAAARLAFLKRVTDFVQLIAQEQGKRLAYTKFATHTHAVYVLKNFENFSFYADIGQTMYGGYHIMVWYHPQHRVLDNGAMPVPDLDIAWHTQLYRYFALMFNENLTWQNEIRELIRKREALLAEKRVGFF